MIPEAPAELLSNGNGRWFALCRWCRRPSPSHTERDGLRILALAQAARWTVTGTAKGYEVVCPYCKRERGEPCTTGKN